MQEDEKSSSFSRRGFVASVVAGSVLGSAGAVEASPAEGQAQSNIAGAHARSSPPVPLAITINRQHQELTVDPRITLLDLLREQLALTGTKKGCDHGQCGACTVLVNGVRINSCLSFALMHEGDEVTTIEGLAQGDELHPMQAAFIEHDGFQCGYCTPGQICSAVAMLAEVRAGVPSVVTPIGTVAGTVELTDEEIRERMSGNICRCGAYPNILAAVRAVERSNGA